MFIENQDLIFKNKLPAGKQIVGVDEYFDIQISMQKYLSKKLKGENKDKNDDDNESVDILSFKSMANY